MSCVRSVACGILIRGLNLVAQRRVCLRAGALERDISKLSADRVVFSLRWPGVLGAGIDWTVGIMRCEPLLPLPLGRSVLGIGRRRRGKDGAEGA